MNIGIDLDGCGARFVEGFSHYCHLVTGRPRADFEEAQVWEFWTQWGMTKDEWLLHFNNFIKDGWFARLPVEEGFVRVMGELRAAGHKVYIVTTRGTNIYAPSTVKHQAKIDTIEWLQKHEVHYDGLLFTTEKEMINCDIFVDDSTKHLEDIQKAGKIAVAFDQTHNQDWDGYRVNSWDKFRDAVQQMVEYRRLWNWEGK